MESGIITGSVYFRFVTTEILLIFEILDGGETVSFKKKGIVLYEMTIF